MNRANLLRANYTFSFLCVCICFTAEISAAKAEKQDEMSQYREILDRPVATVQDLVDLIMMTRGDFAKYANPADRVAAARREGWLGDEAAADALNRGALAFAIMRIYPIDRGLWFRLTHWQRYALRDAQQAGILAAKNGENHKVSGEQLIGAINAAQEFTHEKEQWPENH